ncbi:uncharacterized protein [Macrobrachium rosenbergii]|uniref:uncharacterized protein n=1 Tax=Macrobrachium rosenbergii TaxID=79674 RepID=UPI0034D4E024
MWGSSRKVTVTETSYHSSTKFEKISSQNQNQSPKKKMTDTEEAALKEKKSENCRRRSSHERDDKNAAGESNLRRAVQEKLEKEKFRENCISSEAIALPWVPAESKIPREEPRKCPVSDESNKKVVVELKWLDSEGNASRNGSVEPQACAIKASLTLAEVDKVSEFITHLKMDKATHAEHSADTDSLGNRTLQGKSLGNLQNELSSHNPDHYDSVPTFTRTRSNNNMDVIDDAHSSLGLTNEIKTGSTRCATPMQDNVQSSSADLLGGKTLGTYSAKRSTKENGYAFEDTKPVSRVSTRSATPFDTTSRSFMPVNIPRESSLPPTKTTGRMLNSHNLSDPLTDNYRRYPSTASHPSDVHTSPIVTYDDIELDHMVQSALALARARRGLSLQRILDDSADVPLRRPMSRFRDSVSMSRTDDSDSYLSRYPNYRRYQRTSCEPFDFTSNVSSVKEDNPLSFVPENGSLTRPSTRATSMPAVSRNRRDVRTLDRDVVSDFSPSLNANSGKDTESPEDSSFDRSQMIRGSSPSLKKPLTLPEITEEQDKVPSIVEEMDLLTTYHGAGVFCSSLTDDVPEVTVQRKDPRRGRSISVMRRLLSDGEGQYSREATPMSSLRKQFKEKMRAAGLHEAVLLGDLRTMESILNETDTDVNVADGMDRTALHLAADRGHKDIVVMLIEKGCKVNSPDVEGRTPLHFAVESGDLDVVLALLTAGAEVDVVEKRRGRTPIHLAIVGNNLDILKVLLQPLVDDPQLGEKVLKLTEKDGRTLLHMAAHHGLLEATYMLISAGAEVNVKDVSGNTPMHAVILTRLRRKEKICSKVLEVLLESGGDAEGGIEGENAGEAGTLLHAAAFAGCLDCVRVLLKRSAKLETKNFYGKTPLQIAIEENHVDIVAFLVDNNACVETTDSRGQRPLHYAIMSDSPRLVEEILRSGADRNARDKDGNTYFQYAVIKRRYQALDALVKEKVVDAGEDQQAIHYCASAGDQAGIDVLQNNAFNINATDTKGRTALHLAISSGHESLVLYLLANGASARRADDNGATPLHYAVRWGGSDALLRRLLKQQGNVNEVDRLGRTPLHYAASKSSIMSDMYILINNGAQINVRDARGLTPLHLAARLGNESLVRILLDNDARHDIPDCDQFLPVDHAKENGHKCIIKRLEAYHIKKERDKEARLKFYVAKKAEDPEVVEVVEAKETKEVKEMIKGEVAMVVVGEDEA